MVQLARLPNSQFESGKSNVLHYFFIKSVVQFCKIPKSMKTVVFLSLSHSKELFLINMFTNLQNVPFQNYRREGAQIES